MQASLGGAQAWEAGKPASYYNVVFMLVELQVENFAAVIRGQAKPVIPLVQSVVNTFVLEALVKSVAGRSSRLSRSRWLRRC